MNPLFARLGRMSMDQRFILLLGMIILYLLWEFVLSLFGGGETVQVTILSILLLAAMACLRFKKQSFFTSRVFGALVVVLGWVRGLTDILWLDRIDGLFRATFFLIVTGALIYQVARTPRVSFGMIVGAINGYLLLGIVGGIVARIVDGLVLGAFRFDPQIHLGTSKYLYFSYVTLATVGYGDITPTIPAAQFVAVVLGVSGQLYIATIIALLVGKYLSARPSSS